MNIAQHLERTRRLFPNKPAIIFEEESFSYSEIDEMSSRVANALAGDGISRGDRVALFLPNIPSFVIVYLGIQKMGAIAVSINSTLKTEEIKFILDDSGAKVIVTTETLRRHVPAEELPQLNLILIAEGDAKGADIALSEWMANASPKAQAVDMAHDDPAAILYTSGTTGFPKGATLSYGNVVSNVQTCVDVFKMQPEDRILLFVPMFHNFGQNAALNPCLEAGATLVLHREFEIEPILKSIVNNAVTTFYGVPTIYTLLYEKASAEQMRSVRRYISAAATLPLEMAKKWHEKFGVVINEGYGLTENSLACFNPSLNSKPKLGSVGLPFTGVEMKIVDAEGNEVAPGELGEVTICGPNVMLGYWNRPVETAEVIKEGWFHTGDIGKMDDDGYLFIVDRVKDMVNVGGTKVYPSEIENILYKHPAVVEAAVYGVPEALLGEQVIANLILKPGEEVTTEEIIAFCRQNMADFKVPSQVKLVESLPKGRTGKILKKILREQFQASSSRHDDDSAQKTDHRYPQSIKKWIINWLSKKLALEPETIETDTLFVDYGLTSVLAVNLAQELSDWLGQSIAPVIFWNFPTIELMTRYLVSHRVQKTEEVEQRLPKQDAGDSHLELWPAIEGYFVYDALMYELLANDEPRNRSYQVAIEKLVKDKVVVEIGTGQKVILARLCAEAGARQVYAIEIGDEAYRLALAKVEELGLSDKIKLIHGDATQVNLPEPADVCISEIVGSIGGSQGAAVILNSARRLLRPDGLMIPQRSVTKIAAITLPDELLRHPKMTRLAKHYTQKNFQQVGHPFDVRLCLKNCPPSSIISDNAIFEDLDFTQPIPTEYQHEIKLTIKRKSRLDGFLLWLNLHTIRGEVIDILEKTASWIPIYFPVFEQGVVVSEGDTIQVICSYTLCDNQINPDYRIKGRVARDNGENVVFDYGSYHHEPNFKQTPFYERLFHRFNADLELLQMSGPSGTRVEASDLSTLSDAELAELLRTVEDGSCQGGEISSLNENRDYRSMLENALLTIRDMRLSLKATEQAQTEELIAVIGMGCRFPGGVHTPESFWHLLHNGMDTVTEIPNSRWNVEAYYEPGRYQPGKMYVRTGSFLEGIDQFDPHFFGITPREAASMDPQQRLLLEVSWEALEHAGVAQEQLRDSSTGVFVGVFWDDYSALRLYRDDPSLIDSYRILSHLRSLTAGRIAYTLGLQGPVMQLDTACSSSLLATHLACQSLSRKECHLALAGGVDLNLSPERTIGLCSMNLLAPDGRCKTFDAKADGFGQGEGCGIVILKRFSDAIRDGDNIMALIRGSAVNHDGRSNGLTAPNGLAQEALLRQALENAAVNPDQIQYVETHGTGTSLGDPIEVLALANVLSRGRTTPLAIGSVKTNLGHLSSAAGIASLMKVVLSLQQAEIPPNLHFSEPNPQIPWQELPLWVPTEPTPWTGETKLAGVSSFGMSGTNVHLIVEGAPKIQAVPTVEPEYQLFVLSAKNEERIQVYVKKIVDFLEQEPVNCSLVNLTYTLQVGRNAMEERLAMVVSSLEEVRKKLTQYAQGLTEIENFYRGNVKTNKAQSELLIEGEAGEAFLRIIIEKKELTKLAQLWTYGVEIDWQLLYPSQRPQRISLPTYPFARERYWIPMTKPAPKVVGQIAGLHPLLESNESTLEEQCFKKVFQRQEFYLTDHQVNEQSVLPGVVYLEMAVAAGNLANRKSTVRKLTNIVWARPITVSDQHKLVQISLYPAPNEVEFEVSTLDDNQQRQVHAQGKLTYGSLAVRDSETVEIEAIQKRCVETWGREECYQLFQTTGLNYGPSFQTIQALYRNDSEALSRLQLPKAQKNDFNEFVLHPSLMDGALQTVMGLMGLNTESNPYLPFALGEVELLGPLSETCYAYVRWADSADSAVKKFHLSIVDETGFVSVRIEDFSVRALTPQAETPATLYYQNVWEPSALLQLGPLTSTGTVLLFDTDDGRYNRFKESLNRSVILVTPGERYQVLGTQTYSINPNHPADYRQLLGALSDPKNGLPSHIIHLWSQAPFVSEPAALNAQLMSIFHLSQALLEQKPIEPIQLLYLYLETEEALQPQYAALSGFAKTIRLENPKLNYKTVALPTLDNVLDAVLAEFQANDGVEVRYSDNQRWIKRLQEIDKPREEKAATVLTEKGVYLITGGAGGLGLIFADYLAKQFKAKLVLTGRSELSAEKAYEIQSLNALGAEVIYLQADISKREDVEALIAQTKSRFGRLNGIIHSAGVISDALVLNKTPEEIAAVLAPKVYGTVWLDEATSHEPLDFFVLFSSVAAVMGNVGQCDYAYANSFMDNFAFWREQLRASQKRFGKTLSINWPLWQSGGMQVDDQTKKWLANTMGMQTLSTETGWETFRQGLAWKEISQFMVLSGFRQKINKGLGLESTVSKATPVSVAPDESRQLLEKVQQDLLKAISAILKVSEQDIDLEEDIRNYGVDSISGLMFANRINEIYQLEVTPTLSFEYVSIASMAQFLCEEYQDRLVEHYQTRSEGATLTTAQVVLSEDIILQQNKLKPRFIEKAQHENQAADAPLTETASKQQPQETTKSHEVYPLSHGQQALWFLYQLTQESAAYNIALSLRIHSVLDVPALQNTFQALINRHPCLRTTFTTQEGEPVQEVHQYHTVRFEQIDASTWSWDELNQKVVDSYQKPFDLEKGPVLRVSLFTRASTDHILLLTSHHIISDGWSLWMLITELGVLYPALKIGEQASLPPLKHTYADYVRWHKEMLASTQGERLWAYWQKQLAGELPVLNLPTDHPRPPVQTYHGASVHFVLTETLTQPLKELAQDASLYMVLLAAYQILLYRYTGQEEILVGSATTGRTQSQFTEVAGYFVNMVVLRAKLQGSLTFKAFIRQVRQTVLGALNHQDYPFPLLVKRLQPERDPSRSPLFQVDFVLQKPQQGEIRDLFTPSETEVRVNLGELELEHFEMAQQEEGQFDLSLEMIEAKNSLIGIFKYNTDLFEAATITRMVGHFQTLLEGIVSNPLQLISELPLLTEAERHLLLVEWNNTQADYSKDKCIHQLFEAQVEKTPDAVAIVFGEQYLSYLALNQRANQLAHYLQTLAVKPEVLVGLCVERSIEMVVGLLGILKAGGAYLPLDPTYPSERLAFMLEDAGISVLLTQSRFKEKLPKTPVKMVCLDTEAQTFSQSQTNNVVCEVMPSNLVYVIYTSGSTGTPKGVMIQHNSLVNYTQAVIRQYKLTSHDRYLQFASINFDVATEEIFSTLLIGATLVLPFEEQVAPFAEFNQFIEKENLTVLNLPTPYWHEWVLDLSQTSTPLPDCLRLVMVGSETVRLEPLLCWQKTLAHSVKWLNAYGLTETTIGATFYQPPITDLNEGTVFSVPIGRPLANVQIYILDHFLQPTPVGVPGELHIGGVGLARGYKGRPDLTAKSFIKNPLTDDPNARLYKTGDLVRYRPDGNLEYLGRIDNQVKIRGFRIELGEIEAMLGQHPSVAETAVIVHDISQTDKRLVAYLVQNKTQLTEKTEELRTFLTERLPEYMVPSAFVTLESLPLTPNGKIDRLALSQLSVNRDQLSDEAFVAPRTSEEKLLAGIWADVLGLENVSIFDDFFELGGHSLLATQLVSRICESFAIELPLHYLFQSPTIAGIAQAIEQARQADNQSVTTFIDLKNEAVLDPLIQTSQSSPPVQVDRLANPQAIFLTGATGFLGTYLLSELLAQTTADIYCLTRSSDVDNAQKRLQSQLESYSLWQETYRHRLLPVIGDLSKPLLGLSEPQFSELSEKLEVIYHNGAWVNHIYPYTVLKATNVLGTQEVLRLAFQTKTKQVHFVSTFFSIPAIEESDSLDKSQFVDGYVETKWVAEQLVKQAGERGLPVCIYRPSRVTGHSQTGISNLADIINLLIKGCIQLGKAPVFGEIEEYLTPVDYVSRAIVYLSQQPKQLGKSFDLIHSHAPTRWHDLLFDKLRALGYPLEQTSYASWRTELSHQTTNALYPLLSLFPQREDSVEQSATEEPAFDYRKTISFQNTLEGLADTDIVCPRFDKELLSTYFSYFWNCGFLEAR